VLIAALSTVAAAALALLGLYHYRRVRIAEFAHRAVRECTEPRDAAFMLARAIFSGVGRRHKDPVFISSLLRPLGASPVTVLRYGGCCSGLHRLYITALDTLAHVPDLADVVAGIHGALRPGGRLVTNFDVRPPSPENAWHLYEDDLDLRATVHRAGFVPSGRFGDFVVYRRVDPTEAAQRLRVRFDQLVLTSRPRRAIRRQSRRLAAALRQAG